MTSSNWKILFEYDTEYSADSVEWCPFEPYHHVFVCGTYQLKDTSRERIGKIILFEVRQSLNEIETIHCPAVLDIKWAKHLLYSKMLVGVANSIGEVCVFEFVGAESKLVLLHTVSLKTEEVTGDFLALSLDWCNNPNRMELCVSDSLGGSHIVKITESCAELGQSWKCHSLEEWIICYNARDADVILTGGDDCKLKIWDLRCGTDCSQQTVNKHSAGVTSLHYNLHEEKVVSGSYDEKILLWDSRNWKTYTSEITASGGLWRLKWKPKDHFSHLLSANIYGGYQVFDVCKGSVIGDYREHDSLAYGADWSLLDTTIVNKYTKSDCDDSYLIATCSFYDHRLTVSVLSV